jgi:hypothetical protein
MIHRLFIVMLFTRIATCLAAQEYSDSKKLTVYYADGSVLVGEYLGSDKESLLLMLSTGDIVTLNKNQIDKVRDDLSWRSKQRFHYTEGVFGVLAVGGMQSNWEAASHAMITIGKRLNEKNSVGIGGGIAYADAYLADQWAFNEYVPIYAYGRHYMLGDRRRLYGEAKLGYGFASNINGWNDEHSGGVLFQPGLGVHFASRSRFKFQVFINHVMYKTSGSTRGSDWIGNQVFVDYSLFYSRTVIGFGVELF